MFGIVMASMLTMLLFHCAGKLILGF